MSEVIEFSVVCMSVRLANVAVPTTPYPHGHLGFRQSTRARFAPFTLLFSC